MSDHEPSKTALAVAALRAVHHLIDAFPKILDDPISLQLVDPHLREFITTHPDRYQTPASRALRSHVLVRSRYAEDRLAEAAARGLDQLLILGAGFDTFAYRQPEWAQRLHILEIDQPASQHEK